MTNSSMFEEFGVFEVAEAVNGNNPLTWTLVDSVVGTAFPMDARLRFRPTKPWFGAVNIPFDVRSKFGTLKLNRI